MSRRLGQERRRGRAEKENRQIVDLTFGEYRFLIDNDANWKRIGWTGVPRDQFVHRLDKVRRIRNEIAHFRPDPLTDANLATLEEFAGLLKTVRSLNVPPLDV